MRPPIYTPSGAANEAFRNITREDVVMWTTGGMKMWGLEWLTEILNGEYDLDQAREDCLSICRPKAGE